MKKAISMLCTQEQFIQLKPKLKNCQISDISGNFNSFCYLVNNFRNTNNNIANVGREDCQNSGREVFETWNENTFLAACGIKIEKPIRTNKLTELEKRVEILEHKVDLKKIVDMPSNPELKQPFAGIKAPIYESLLKAIKEGKIVIPKTTNIIEELKNYKPMSLNLGLDFGHGFMQPHLSDSFDIFQQYEILKQENNKLKLRIEELEAENKAILSAPNAKTMSFTASSTFDFKDMPMVGTEVKELEVGKWYKGNKDFNSLICIERIENKIDYDEIHCYGFWFDGWKKGYIANTSHQKSLIEATESEVFEALKDEAVKRGYKHGVYLKYPWYRNEEGIFKIEMNEGDFSHVTKLTDGGFLLKGTHVFFKGKWAEIIPTITKVKAEKELGKKIV